MYMPQSCNSYDVLIFDIGDVLFTWTAGQKLNIDAHMFKRMIGTQTWHNLETGKLSDDDAYTSLSAQFSVIPKDIREAVLCATDSLVCRSEMFELIETLKPGRKIYAMSNMSLSSWEIVKAKGATYWDMFDGIFISGAVGARKPELPFYHHVLRETGAIPEGTIFVDDNRDNIVAARSLGINCVLYDTFANVHRALRNLCGDTLARASHFLISNAKHHDSYISTGQIIQENFCQLLILEVTEDSSLVDYIEYQAECNFFKGSGQFTTTKFPNDLDTTSIAWTVIPDVTTHDTKMKVMDRMLTFCNSDGIPLAYFDWNRPRRDHIVCINVLTLFFAHGRGDDLSKAVDWIHSVLRTGAYMEGSTYYEGAEIFL